MNALPNHSQDSLRRILDAAAGEFADKGYDGARMEAIARRAGVNKALLYYHVGDKPALYQEVLDRVFADMAAGVTVATATAQEPATRLRRLITTIGGHIGRHNHFAPIMMREIAGGATRLSDDNRKAMLSIVRTLNDILHEGQARKLFRPSDALITHILIIGSMMFYSAGEPLRRQLAGELNNLNQNAETAIDQVAEQVANMILAAVSVTTDSSQGRAL